MNIDQILSFVNASMTKCAVKAFGKPQAKPRKECVSSNTWEVMKQTPFMRRSLHSLVELRNTELKRLAFCGWCSLSPEPFPHVRNCAHGWKAKALALAARTNVGALNRIVSCQSVALRNSLAYVKQLCAVDRNTYLCNKSWDICRAMS